MDAAHRLHAALAAALCAHAASLADLDDQPALEPQRYHRAMRVLPVMLVLPMLACAATRPNVPSTVAEREILDIERAWDDAEVHRDAAALNEILDAIPSFEGRPAEYVTGSPQRPCSPQGA